MRPVAILLAGLFLALVLPTNALARDECASAPAIRAVPGCITIPGSAAPSPVPTQHDYYLYYSWVQCPLNTFCTGSPPASLVGLLWEDTNGLSGLQRSNTLGTPPDTPLLL